MANIHIFLSTVSAEFRSYRDALRHDLDRPNVAVKVQEDFIASGTETLDKLDDYIRQCDAVIHLVGDMSGAGANATAVAAIRQRYTDLAQRLPVLAAFLIPGAPALSYTQWEAWLALYHRKRLIIAVPQEGAPRHEYYILDPAQRAGQQAHLERLASTGRYPEISFANADRLAVGMLRSKLQDILALAGVVTKLINLPYLSIGDLFKGREAMLGNLNQRFGSVPESVATPVAARVLNGLGGVGKTRLALEYAWKRAREYTAMLFVTADSPESLQRNLAALCGPSILNLPEQGEMDQDTQRNAVVAWLRQHPGWLLILDNIDSEEAATAAEALLPHLTGGHALLTTRLGNWSGSMAALPLDVLSPEAAVDFLLARTADKHRAQPDDPDAARSVAEELGRLALALEQAGAYIAQRRLSFTAYLTEWQHQRDKVLDWFDPRLMQYPGSVAITWQTSFARLGEPARRLLQRLAWLAPEPIPESLLEVALPDAGEADRADLFGALAELESYSLATRAADTPTFSVHRLVQEVTRRSQRSDPAHAALVEALQWLDHAFVGNPQDVRTWPVLVPLAPHVQAVAAQADAAGLAEPTARLLNELALLYKTQGQYTQAGPLCQRALAIKKKTLGPEHPDVALSLNNLALLYHAQGRYAQAKPLHQRALAIREKALGPDHPDVAQSLNNLALLYDSQGRYAQAEPLYQRALAIWEKALGPDHPDVATSLNNLASLYYSQGQYTQTEPLYQRALTIWEKTLGPDHPDVVLSQNNLAALYDSQGRYAQAEPLYQRALAIWETTLGPEHPHVAQSLGNIAALYRKRGRDEEAAALDERAAAIRALQR